MITDPFPPVRRAASARLRILATILATNGRARLASDVEAIAAEVRDMEAMSRPAVVREGNVVAFARRVRT